MDLPPMALCVRGVVGPEAVLTLIACSARLYWHRFMIREFGLAEVVVIIAMILALFFEALSIALSFYGIGSHQKDVPSEKLRTMEYCVYISLCTYLPVVFASKASVILSIMRIFPTNFIRKFGNIMLGVWAAFTVSGTAPLVFQCTPVRAAYDKTIPSYKCFSPGVLFGIQMYQAVFVLLVDLVIFVMPIPTIWKLQMPIRRRLVVIGYFALGLLASATCVARLPFLSYEGSQDYTYVGAIALILMNTENFLCLIAGSLPSLRKLITYRDGESCNEGNFQLKPIRREDKQPTQVLSYSSQERIIPGLEGCSHL